MRYISSGISLAAGCLIIGLPALRADDTKKDSDGWVQLFNGKDLTGWKIHEKPSGDITEVIKVEKDGIVVGFDAKLKNGKTTHLWRVEDGLLIGSGPPSHLFSERGDYVNFKYRVEAKINDHGNSGQYFRTDFGPGFPSGYETQINSTHGDKIRTGSLYPDGRDNYSAEDKKKMIVLEQLHKPDEFFVQEVTAIGDTITISVNGKVTLDGFKDAKYRHKKGHFALQGHDPGTVVTFKKVEVKELPAE